MKYNIFFLVGVFIFIACKNDQINTNGHKNLDNNKEIKVIDDDQNIQKSSKSIIGSWNWRSNDKSQEFTIKIKKIDNDSVFGQYCAVYNNGNKLDCDFDDINNIKGLIVNDKIQLSFYSFFGAKNGKAEIKIFENYIEWKIIKSPKGEYYSPESATLYKKILNDESKPNEIDNVNQPDASFIYDKKIDINNVKYDILSNKIKGIKKFSCDEKKIRYLQLPNKKNVTLILVPQDCADFNYRFYLLTILNDRIISNQYV